MWKKERGLFCLRKAANPITRVRQSAKRSRIPVILSIVQIQALLSHLREPVRTMVLVDISTGLRIGELLALQWRDINFENLEISVTRSISLQHIGQCKTEASRKPVPMDAELAESLWRWRSNCAYPMPLDWVFASPAKGGQQPSWPGTLYRAHLAPAAKAAGITEKIGWHTFRHYAGCRTIPDEYIFRSINTVVRSTASRHIPAVSSERLAWKENTDGAGF